MARRAADLGIHLLREPELPARESMDDDALDELAESIRLVGLIERIVVRPISDGLYEIVAGHRRYKACRRAGLDVVPCDIFDDDENAEARKLHENLLRERLNPGEEAVYLAQYLELYCGGDCDELARRMKRTRGYVEGRLALLTGDKAVLEAIKRGRLKLAVAELLNKVIDDRERVFLLEHAERGGATTAIVKQWVQEANQRAELQRRMREAEARGERYEAPAPAPTPAPEYLDRANPHELTGSTTLRYCLICDVDGEEWTMYRVSVCKPCADIHMVRGGQLCHPASDRPAARLEVVIDPNSGRV